jgi:hypothetical protein
MERVKETLKMKYTKTKKREGNRTATRRDMSK